MKLVKGLFHTPFRERGGDIRPFWGGKEGWMGFMAECSLSLPISSPVEGLAPAQPLVWDMNQVTPEGL